VRSDIRAWLNAKPPGFEQVRHEVIAWGIGMSFHVRVFDLGPSLLLVAYVEPKIDQGIRVVPVRVMERMQELLEPYRADPRAWVNSLWDEKVAGVEWPVGDGWYNRAWFGDPSAIQNVAENLGPQEMKGPPVTKTASTFLPELLSWLGFPVQGGTHDRKAQS